MEKDNAKNRKPPFGTEFRIATMHLGEKLRTWHAANLDADQTVRDWEYRISAAKINPQALCDEANTNHPILLAA